MHRQNGSTALCAIRSNLKQEAAELVANYTYLSSVESAFRGMKTISLQVRPIYHRNKTWEIVHVFCLCWLTMWRISVPKAGTGAVCPSGGKAQRKNAVEVADLKAKKKARTRHNEEDKRAIHLASLMSQLEEPSRLIMFPKTGQTLDKK